MTRMNRLLAAAAIMLMSGIAVCYAQYGTGRALLIPCKGKHWSRRTPTVLPVMIGRLLRPDTIPRLCMQPSNIG